MNGEYESEANLSHYADASFTMRKYEFIAMSALLLAAEDPNSELSSNRRAMILINNEMAMVSGQGAFARSESAKLKWLGKLDKIEQDVEKLMTEHEEPLSQQQLFSLQGTRESIADMRDLLKIE